MNTIGFPEYRDVLKHAKRFLQTKCALAPLLIEIHHIPKAKRKETVAAFFDIGGSQLESGQLEVLRELAKTTQLVCENFLICKKDYQLFHAGDGHSLRNALYVFNEVPLTTIRSILDLSQTLLCSISFNSEIFWALLRVPPSEQHSLVQVLKDLRGCNAEVIKLMLAIEPELRGKFIGRLQLIFPDLDNSSLLEKVVCFLQAVPEPEWEQIAECAQTMLDLKIKPLDRLQVLTQLMKMHSAQREEFLSDIIWGMQNQFEPLVAVVDELCFCDRDERNFFFTYIYSASRYDYMGSYIALQRFTIPERIQILEHAKPLFSKDARLSKIGVLFRYLSNVPRSEINDLIVVGLPLCKSELDNFEHIKTLALIPIEERKELVELVLKLDDRLTYDERLSCLKEFACIPKKQRAEFFELCKGLDRRNYKIISLLLSCHPQDRKRLMELTHTLAQEKGWSSQQNVMSELNKIPSHSWKEAIENEAIIHEHFKTTVNRESYLSAAVKFSSKELQKLLPDLKPFVTDNIYLKDNLKYLNFLHSLTLIISLIQPVLKEIKKDLHLSIAWEFIDIPTDELRVLIPQIAPFMKTSLTKLDFGIRKGIALCIYRCVPQKNRFILPDVLELSRDLTRHLIPTFIARLIKECPATELRALQKHYPLIKRFSEDSHERFIFIRRLLEVPFDEREEVLAMVQSVNCRAQEYDEIIIQLLAIPCHQRRAFFERAQTIYSAIPQTSSQTFSVFSSILSGLREIPLEGHYKAIEDLFMHFSLDVQNVNSLIKSVGNVSASKRIRLIDYLQPIFRDYQASQDRDCLFSAFIAIPEEEWDSLRDFFMEFFHSKITLTTTRYLEEFQRIGIEKSRRIISSFKHQISSLTTPSDIVSFVKSMDAIAEEHRSEMLMLARLLLLNIHRKTSLTTYGEVAQGLFKLGEVKRKILLEEGRFLTYPQQPHSKIMWLMDVADKLSPENLSDICKHVKTLRPHLRPDTFWDTLWEIINTLSQISCERREDFVTEARFWLRDAEESHQVTCQLKCLLAAEHSRSKGILQHMDLWIPDHDVDAEYSSVSHLHQLLAKFPDQHPLLIQKLKLLKLKYKSIGKAYSVLQGIPLNKWDFVIELTDMLMRGYDAIYPIRNLLAQLNVMTSDQLNRLPEWKPYLEGHSVSVFLAEYLNALCTADSKKLEIVLNIYHSTSWPKAWDNHSEIIKKLLDLNKDQLSIVETVKPWMAELESVESYIWLLETLKQFDPKKQAEFMEFALRFKLHWNHFNNRGLAFRQIPFTRLMKMVETAAPILNLLRKDDHIGRFLLELNAIQENEWGHVIHLVQHFYQEHLLENHQGSTVLSKLIKLTPKQREEIVSIAHTIISTQANHACIIEILDALVNLPETVLKEMPKYSRAYSLPVFPNIAGGFIASLGKLPELEKTGLETRLAPIMNTYGYVKYKVLFISALHLFPPRLHDELIAHLLKASPAISSQYHHPLMKMYYLINSRYWSHLTELFMNHKDDPNYKILNRLFTDREIRDATIEHLLKVTEKEIENKKFIHEVSLSIICHANSLRLDEEHPLFQRAIEMRCILSDHLDDKQNPYVLHQQLRKLINAEMLIEHPMCKASLANLNIALDLTTIRSNALKKVYTVNDLPRNIPSDAFHVCFNQLLTRLKLLPDQDRLATIKHIENGYLSPPKRLRELFLETPVILNMLSVKDSLDHVIEPTVFYLYAILKFLMDQEDVLKPGQLLTDREDRLCQISCSINACPTGQRDGVVGYYNRLPISYRTSEEILRKAEAKAVEMIDSVMQSVLYDTCAEPELVTRITGESRISYGPHQTLYLMNRLHRQIGLRHRVVFDMNAGVIYQRLVDAPLELLLEKFFEVFDLREGVKRLRNEIAEGLASENIVYMDLVNVLEPCVKAFYKLDKLQPGDFTEYFEFSDELEPKGLTEKGAVFLMLGAKYFRVIM